MTARELCNYLVAVAGGDYEVNAGYNNGTHIIFTKFITGTQLYNPNTHVVCETVYRRMTCRDVVHFIAKRNLEDYAVVSPLRLWRVVNYMDISVDPVRREVVFR